MKKEKQEKNWFLNIGIFHFTEGQFVLAVYVISVIIRFVTGAYMKHIETIADERLYRNMAETIAGSNVERLRLFGEYRRILYPLIVSPAFLFKGRYAQTIVYQFINSLLISSSIFPMFLLARKTVRNRNTRVICYLFFLLLPELCQSVTFASENLYLPLTTWAVLLFFSGTEHKDGNSGMQNLILGGIVYMLKLCKDAGLIIYFGASLYYVVEAICEKSNSRRWIRVLRRIVDIMAIGCTYLTIQIVGQHSWLSMMEQENKKIEIKEFVVVAFTLVLYMVISVWGQIKLPEKIRKISAIMARVSCYFLIVMAVAFVVIVIVDPTRWNDLTITILKIMIPQMEKYSSISLKWYGIYAVYNIMYVMMAVGILPVVLPVMYPDCLNEQSRRLYWMNTCLCIVGTIFITFYINVGGEETIPPRGIIRYICFLWIPYMLCFASMYEKKREEIDKKKMIVFVSIMAAFIIFFNGAKTGSSIDMDMLFYIVYHFTYVMWQLKIPLAVLGIITIPLYHRKRELLFICFAIAMGLVWLLDNGLMLIDHYNRYGMSDEEYEKIAFDDELIRENPDKKILVINDTKDTDESRQLTKFRISFIEPYTNVYSVSLDGALGYVDEVGRIMADALAVVCGVEKYDYVLIQYDIPYRPEGTNVMLIENTAEAYFRAWETDAGTVISPIDTSR